MIKLKRLNGKEFVINCDLIEFVESTPDTVIKLTTGNKVIVCDNIDEVINKVVEFKRNCNSIFINEKEEASYETHNCK